MTPPSSHTIGGTMARIDRRVFPVLAAIVLGVCSASAQPDLRAQLFGEADRALKEAQERHADVYAPTSFTRGMEAYNEAEDYFKRGKPIDKIQERLTEALSAFSKSIQASELGEKTFPETMAARTDAQKADAPKLYPDLWNDAEKLFRSGASDLEDGDLRSARKEASEAQTIYRKAELESIKAKFLNPTRALLKQADANDVKDNAPKTLTRATALTARVETMLGQNRYNNAEARALAEEAQYEAQHAHYLHRTITQLKKQEQTFEDVILASETPLKTIATAAGLTVRFDSGYAPATQAIVASIKGPDTAAQRMAATIRRQDSLIAVLSGRLAGFQPRASAALPAATTDQQRRLDDAVAQIVPLFTADEADILTEGSNIVIRVYAIAFTAGRNTVESRSNSLLSRLNTSIRKFPGCQVSIEGHTEAIGSEISNQRVSAERAEAVAGYLKANLPSTIAVTTAGYGGARPVGPSGKNKRIDVIIVPEWAIVGR
jgi:OmpA-OmpF porin, OOP family